ncbi:transglycosylase SLT domain-containing protein [Pseudomonas chlororaphis]|uniref:transglycosylase SLT domain-containing protein n=1 Tax=Pseudomonas chlororaphis TaxID=587753 RepID=UPI0030D48858
MSWRVCVVVLLAQLWVGGASANCWVEVGARHFIEPELLYAIAQVESGLKLNVVNRNADGSRDVGLMQINSIHFPRLQLLGITEQRLRNEPCLAVEVGASILSEFIGRYGYNWTAVGAYNAGTSPARQALRLRYAGKVWARYRALLESGSTPFGA